MARDDRHPDEAPQQRSRLFWICVLVLIEALVWTGLSVLGASGLLSTIVAIIVGVVVVFLLRDRIWGEDWRDQVAAERRRSERHR